MADYSPEVLYQNSNRRLIMAQLDACETASRLAERGGTSYTEWELGFLRSIREQVTRNQSERPLTGKQLVKLRDLYNRS